VTVSEKTTPLIDARAGELLRAKSVWIFPVIVGSILMTLMTIVYFGAIVDPAEHLHGLPVLVVNQDSGANVGSARVELGREVVAALTQTHAVTDRLSVKVVTLDQADAQMNIGADYVTVDIPSNFTLSTVAFVGLPVPSHGSAELPTIKLMTNSRAGSLGVSLALGVLEPALADVSHAIGEHLKASAPPGSVQGKTAIFANPLTISSVPYRPLPAHSGLGLSAFYVALLVMMSGFLGATIVNTAVDTALGYATSEVGPWWRQKLPRRISRWHTLLVKWAVAVPSTLLFTGLLLAVAAGILRMDAPHLLDLWLFAWFAAAVIAIGTLALFAILGALGQLVALLLFVYLGLASSGGTIPLQALGGFYRFVASFEPLRQILGAVRAILYFNAYGDAGLDRGLLLAAIGLVFWVVVGTAGTMWYDRKGLYRMQPGLMEYVRSSASAYGDQDQIHEAVEDPSPTVSE
jgi:YhgE/Pip-like protein